MDIESRLKFEALLYIKITDLYFYSVISLIYIIFPFKILSSCATMSFSFWPSVQLPAELIVLPTLSFLVTYGEYDSLWPWRWTNIISVVLKMYCPWPQNFLLHPLFTHLLRTVTYCMQQYCMYYLHDAPFLILVSLMLIGWRNAEL